MTTLQAAEQTLYPTRGLVLAQNAKGKPLGTRTVLRYLRVNRTVYKTDKVDVLTAPPQYTELTAIADYGRRFDTAVSLRAHASAPPENLAELAGAGLFDVFVSMDSGEADSLAPWLEACQNAALPLRVQLQPPLPEPQSFAAQLKDGPVKVVNVALDDFFHPTKPGSGADESRRRIARMTAAVQAVSEAGIETNLIGVPFCMVPEDARQYVANSAQFFLDHQHYHKLSYDLAKMLHVRSPVITSKLVLIMLAQQTYMRSRADRMLFPWLAFSFRFNVWATLLRRLTHHLSVLRRCPRPLPAYAQVYAELMAQRGRKDREADTRSCGGCALLRICDAKTPPVKRTLPGVDVTPREGEPVLNPHHFSKGRPRYFDPIDRDRLEADTHTNELAQEALAIVEHRQPDREIDSFEHEIEGQWSHQMPGAIRWNSVTNTEKTSTVLLRAEPPLTLSVTFGGGVADFIGFAFGRLARVVCPMVEFSHKLVLYVDAEGRYVLLRDGAPVRPVQFEGAYYIPPRLSNVLEPRIAIMNIDMSVVTQTVQVWHGEAPLHEPAAGVKYSVLIVSTRYARRLQAVLRSIAHQRGFDLSQAEVVIAYVPGIDPTDDLIDSMRLAFPELRLVRAPYAAENARSKGYMINESAGLASGEWLVLLDSDTLLPPDFFARLDAVEAQCDFAAPDGRVMLDRATTAKVLLGEVAPWEEWDRLTESGGEFRFREAMGMPIGFCQCVRRKVLEQVPYEELDHFEGADWRFADNVRRQFGDETRLPGLPVLHLDHEGSQWYGAKKHF